MRFGCCAGPDMGEALAQAGYDYVELSVSRHLRPEADDKEWTPLRRAIEAQPLPVEAFNTFLPADLKVTGPTVDEERISREDEQRIERLFKQVKQDRSKAYELKGVLDRLGVFKDYEDRFLDLFKKPE